MGISAPTAVFGALGLLVLMGLAAKVAILVFRQRRSVSFHTGKITAMTSGLMCAMTSGSILTGIFQADPLWATVISTIAGATVGVVMGIPLHLSISMEGFAAGVMGGGMGSMPMVSSPQVLSGFWWVLSLGAFLALHRLLTGGKTGAEPHPEAESGQPDGTDRVLARRMAATAVLAAALALIFTLLLPALYAIDPPLIRTPMCGS